MSRQGKAQARTTEHVREFWDKEAHEWGDNPQVTIRDHYFRLLELRLISDLIRGRSKLLDIGCGTGFSTLFYAQEVGEAVGADYAAKMVAWARRFLDDPAYFAATMKEFAPDGAPKLKGNVHFEEGNILEIPYAAATFDTVVAERVLINLPTRDLQDRGVAEVARVLQPQGLALFVEVTQQGHETVDRLRGLFGLPIIEKYWHNLYVDEDHFLAAVEASGFTLAAIRRFETFHFLTKVVHPLVVAPAEPKFLAGFNNAARQVAAAFPTHKSVATVGLETFLVGHFRPCLEALDPEKLEGYDRVVKRVVSAAPDFTGCSHQVLFQLQPRSA